jgi:transglutaminase-like putative cysteine protease
MTDHRDTTHRDTTHRGRTLASDLVATIALATFSTTVALGFARVFSSWPFVRDLVIVVLVGHGLGLVLRRLRLTPWVAVPLMALGLGWAVLAVYYPDTFSWGLPTADTWSILRLQLTSVREAFPSAVAPVNYGGGWDVLAAMGLATAVLLADVFAFRADGRAEALVPGGVLFVFVGALADERLRVISAVLLVGVGVVTTVVLRWYHAEGNSVSSPAMRWRRLPVALALGLVVAVAAGVAGPKLPGADAAPLLQTGGRSGSVTSVFNPLVDIKSRLTNRSTDELFRIRADDATYWRLTALPDFDGRTWQLRNGQSERVDDPTTVPTADSLPNVQQLTIGALGGELVPAAADASTASGPDPLQLVPETSTLVIVDGELERGDVIDIVSNSPVTDPARLAAATSLEPPDPIYTTVPSDLPEVVATRAREVAGADPTTYEAALLLQRWFQSEFTYSLEVQEGHGNSAIENFLRDRVGYCEQFAGTYAAMMRTLGIPARVAVGFTWGVEVGDGEYSVLGRNAHAWPEIWFDDIGWVKFEPTPTRGASDAENYTGVAPQQDDSVDVADIDESDEPSPTIPPGTPDDPFAFDLPDGFTDPAGGDPAPPTASVDDGGGVPLWVVAVFGLLGLAVAAPPAVRFVRRRVTIHTVDEQVRRSWDRATAAVRSVGVPVRPSDTPLEVAANTARDFPVVTRAMASLADTVTEAAYGAEGTADFDIVGAYGASRLNDCRHWAKQIDRAATDSLPWTQRVRRYFTTWQ